MRTVSTMSHVHEELSALLDGELAPADRARVEEHLAACAECAAVRAELSRALGSLRTVEPIEPSAGLRRRVLAAVDAEPLGAAARFRALLSPRFWVPAAAALAAGLALFFAASRPEGADADLEIAERLELLQDYDVVATALPPDIAAGDLEVVARLHELQE